MCIDMWCKYIYTNFIQTYMSLIHLLVSIYVSRMMHTYTYLWWYILYVDTYHLYKVPAFTLFTWGCWGSSCKFLWVSWLLGFMRYLVDANHPNLVATLCSSFSRENGHTGCSFAHHDTHSPAIIREIPRNCHTFALFDPRPTPPKKKQKMGPICATVKSRYIGDGHPTFNRNPYNGYINPYYWVDDHPLLYGNNGS